MNRDGRRSVFKRNMKDASLVCVELCCVCAHYTLILLYPSLAFRSHPREGHSACATTVFVAHTRESSLTLVSGHAEEVTVTASCARSRLAILTQASDTDSAATRKEAR